MNPQPGGPDPTRGHAGGATASVVAAALCWATMGIFVRKLDQYRLSPMEIVAVRAFITFLLLTAIALVARREALAVRPRDLWCFFGTGICSMVFFNYCYFLTITLTSLSVAAVLLYTAPAIVMLLSLVLFRERPTAAKVIALGLAFIGCVLAARAQSDTPGAPLRLDVRGIVTGLGAGLGYALYSIFGRYALQRGYSPLTISTYTFAFASLGTALLVEAPELARAVVSDAGLGAWSVAMAVCTTVLPYLLYTSGLRHLEPSRAAIIASVEPVGATVIGALVFGESLGATGITGVALVVASIVLLSSGGRN